MQEHPSEPRFGLAAPAGAFAATPASWSALAWDALAADAAALGAIRYIDLNAALPHNPATVDPTGAAWTYTGSAGLAGNGSAFTSGNPSAPLGTQVGIIQQAGQISQTINLPAGVYSLSFAAAQRTSNSQTIEVLFDGTPIAFVSPSSTSYTTFTTNNFAATAGANSLIFLGLNPLGGDNTAFIDQVVLNVANGAQNGGFASLSLGTGPTALNHGPSGSP